MAITRLPVLWTTLVVVSAQMHFSEQNLLEDEQLGPIIENKNVNINVNVNAQELAQELLKIIESRLNNRTNHITSSKSIMKELKETIIPLISQSRRGGTFPSIFQVATQLDKITRKAIIRDTPSINMLDEEIITRDTVADMLAITKINLSKQIYLTNKKDNFGRRMMQRPATTTMSGDDEPNNYVNVRIKIHRKDIRDAFN